MFGEIFSLKNILIFIAIMFSMSFVMNTLNKGSSDIKDSNIEEKFTSKDVKEMFTDVKTIKNNLGKLSLELKELREKIKPSLTNLKKKNTSSKKSKSKNTSDDDSSEEESYEKKKRIRQDRKKASFEEKFTGYNSKYGQDYLLLDE